MDRLSGLPDEVIGHILSFLPTTRSFVQTSILAKQWRFLWTRSRYLGFTVDEPKMINNFHNNEFKSWIDTILARNVRNTVIRLNYQLTLPRCLFTSHTLVDLCIIDSGDIPKSGIVYFPALKRLQLVNVGYVSGDSLDHMVSGCPVLEEVVIDRMMLNSPPCVLELLKKMEKFKGMKQHKPALSYLRIRAHKVPFISSWDLGSLVEADIDLSEAKFFPSLSDFLRGLQNVKRLTLTSRLMEIPNHFVYRRMNFRNLTEVNLRADWHFITCFLLYAENIRVLTIHSMVDDPNCECWIEPHPSHPFRTCSISHLETVNLVDFWWSREPEFEMVKYILRKAEVLKTVEIIHTARHIEFDWDKKNEALKRLASFEKASTACCISLKSKEAINCNDIGHNSLKLSSCRSPFSAPITHSASDQS